MDGDHSIMRKRITFYSKLYIGERAQKKSRQIIWRLKCHAGTVDTYVLMLPDRDDAQLEIMDAAYLKQDYYKWNPPYIVGIAIGRAEADELMKQIVDEVYQKTGFVDIRSFLLNQ